MRESCSPGDAGMARFEFVSEQEVPETCTQDRPRTEYHMAHHCMALVGSKVTMITKGRGHLAGRFSVASSAPHAGRRSVGRGHLGMVDDEGGDRAVGGGEFEAKLLFDGGEDGDDGAALVGRFVGGPLEGDVGGSG